MDSAVLTRCGSVAKPIWTMKIDLVSDITKPVQQPEKRNGKQGADNHKQSDKKPDLLLMPGQTRFSPATVMISHSFIQVAAPSLQSAQPMQMIINSARTSPVFLVYPPSWPPKNAKRAKNVRTL
jgi:hypothetical protein